MHEDTDTASEMLMQKALKRIAGFLASPRHGPKDRVRYEALFRKSLKLKEMAVVVSGRVASRNASYNKRRVNDQVQKFTPR